MWRRATAAASGWSCLLVKCSRVKHLRRIADLWPQAGYYNLYGPTETNVCTFARVPTPVPPDREVRYPIGWACSHCTPLVLDEPHGQVVGRGQEGLLYIAGPSVFPGYGIIPSRISAPSSSGMG